MKRLALAIAPLCFLLGACSSATITSPTTPSIPGAEPVARADLTRSLTAAQRRNSVIITHHDATQNFETHYRVLNPTGVESIEAAALQVCRRIDPRYFASKLVEHRPPSGTHLGRKLYFSCI